MEMPSEPNYNDRLEDIADDALGDEFEEDYDFDFDDFDFDCHMDRDGNCGKAGSEECDWECPYGPPNN